MRFFGSKLFLAALLAAVIVVGMGVGRVIVQNRALAREVAALQREADAFESKNSEFFELLRRIKTDSFLERDARVKLGLKKPGEEVMIVRRNETATSTSGALAKSETNLERWWRYFFAPGQRNYD